MSRKQMWIIISVGIAIMILLFALMIKSYFSAPIIYYNGEEKVDASNNQGSKTTTSNNNSKVNNLENNYYQYDMNHQTNDYQNNNSYNVGYVKSNSSEQEVVTADNNIDMSNSESTMFNILDNISDTQVGSYLSNKKDSNNTSKGKNTSNSKNEESNNNYGYSNKVGNTQDNSNSIEKPNNINDDSNVIESNVNSHETYPSNEGGSTNNTNGSNLPNNSETVNNSNEPEESPNQTSNSTSDSSKPSALLPSTNNEETNYTKSNPEYSFEEVKFRTYYIVTSGSPTMIDLQTSGHDDKVDVSWFVEDDYARKAYDIKFDKDSGKFVISLRNGYKNAIKTKMQITVSNSLDTITKSVELMTEAPERAIFIFKLGINNQPLLNLKLGESQDVEIICKTQFSDSTNEGDRVNYENVKVIWTGSNGISVTGDSKPDANGYVRGRITATGISQDGSPAILVIKATAQYKNGDLTDNAERIIKKGIQIYQ